MQTQTNNLFLSKDAEEELLGVYLDCNATTPVDPQVADFLSKYYKTELGNAGSRTHGYGARAKAFVQNARKQIANIVGVEASDVVFTSGATESNNIAILGLAAYGIKIGKRHIVTSAIEHKAVLEPLEQLDKMGFEITYVSPDNSGRIDPQEIKECLREETLLVSIMHANNETGVIQPIEQIASILKGHDAFFHVDAAQGFGKIDCGLSNDRVDLISVSSHKIYGPCGVGALVMRRRDFVLPPLTPIQFGGGQERKLRPGTLPVALIAGFGLAVEISSQESEYRNKKNLEMKKMLMQALGTSGVIVNGNEEYTMPHVLNISILGVDSEAAMVALKGVAAISNGSACTSNSYQDSHVLTAMGVPEEQIRSALRVSWSHHNSLDDIAKLVEGLKKLM